MELLINGPAALRGFLPNVLREVKGEVPLYDKMVPFLELAQKWLCAHFLPAELVWRCGTLAGHAVAVEAYRLAVPQLDIVLTPNGFATVGSQNLVPASKMRTDRLVDGLLRERDAALALLLRELPSVHGWLDSPQGRWFSATFFPFLDDVLCPEVFSGSWKKYLELRPRVESVEFEVAERWLSPELLADLRVKHVAGVLSPVEFSLVSRLRPVIVSALDGTDLDVARLDSLVDFVRKRPSDFPLWVDSETAQLFRPPVFRNEKGSRGYFF